MNPVYYTTNYEKWNNTWKVNKSDIDDFKVNWNKPGYKIPESISTGLQMGILL